MAIYVMHLHYNAAKDQKEVKIQHRSFSNLLDARTECERLGFRLRMRSSLSNVYAYVIESGILYKWTQKDRSLRSLGPDEVEHLPPHFKLVLTLLK